MDTAESLPEYDFLLPLQLGERKLVSDEGFNDDTLDGKLQLTDNYLANSSWFHKTVYMVHGTSPHRAYREVRC